MPRPNPFLTAAHCWRFALRRASADGDTYHVVTTGDLRALCTRGSCTRGHRGVRRSIPARHQHRIAAVTRSQRDPADRAAVRNPILALPAMTALRQLTPDMRTALRAILVDLAADARTRADESWRRHKAPMAAYWKAVSVYAGHIARVLR